MNSLVYLSKTKFHKHAIRNLKNEKFRSNFLENVLPRDIICELNGDSDILLRKCLALMIRKSEYEQFHLAFYKKQFHAFQNCWCKKYSCEELMELYLKYLNQCREYIDLNRLEQLF